MDVSSSDALWAATGLGSVARQALEYLVSHPGADEDAVAAGTGVSTAAARTALRSLEAELLAVRIEGQRVEGQPTRWSAGPPRSSLGALLARKRQELARAELYAEQLDEVYRTAPGRQIASDLFEVVESDEQVGARYAHLLRSSRHEVLHFARPPYVTRRIAPTDTSTAAGATVRPGVRLRSVYDSDGIADDGCHAIPELATALPDRADPYQRSGQATGTRRARNGLSARKRGDYSSPKSEFTISWAILLCPGMSLTAKRCWASSTITSPSSRIPAGHTWPGSS